MIVRAVLFEIYIWAPDFGELRSLGNSQFASAVILLGLVMLLWPFKEGFKVSSGTVGWYSSSYATDFENSEIASPAFLKPPRESSCGARIIARPMPDFVCLDPKSSSSFRMPLVYHAHPETRPTQGLIRAIWTLFWDGGSIQGGSLEIHAPYVPERSKTSKSEFPRIRGPGLDPKSRALNTRAAAKGTSF